MRSFLACLFGISAVLLPGVASADEPKAEPKGPVVELSADEGHATIEKRTGTSAATGLGPCETGVLSVGHWQEVCVAPCQVRLDPNASYRVSGEGLVPSNSFTLPRNEDHVRVDAKMGSSPGRVGGMLLTATGIASLALGGLALGASPILASEDVGSEGFRTGVLAGGIGAVSIGAIALTTGIFLWLSNGSSAHTLTASASR
jgi:hypothetical protein